MGVVFSSLWSLWFGSKEYKLVMVRGQGRRPAAQLTTAVAAWISI